MYIFLFYIGAIINKKTSTNNKNVPTIATVNEGKYISYLYLFIHKHIYTVLFDLYIKFIIFMILLFLCVIFFSF